MRRRMRNRCLRRRAPPPPLGGEGWDEGGVPQGQTIEKSLPHREFAPVARPPPPPPPPPPRGGGGAAGTGQRAMPNSCPASSLNPSYGLRARLLAQLQSDLLVHELQCVGLAVVEARLHHPGSHHLCEELRHARVRHGAHTEFHGVA